MSQYEYIGLNNFQWTPPELPPLPKLDYAGRPLTVVLFNWLENWLYIKKRTIAPMKNI